MAEIPYDSEKKSKQCMYANCTSAKHVGWEGPKGVEEYCLLHAKVEISKTINKVNERYSSASHYQKKLIWMTELSPLLDLETKIRSM
ncbi:MAG: hypothetical protein AABX88_02390 [Nanoarchaeota archaeon]